MATELYSTENYRLFSHRGGGISLRSTWLDKDVFFQPGDDANAMRDQLDAIEQEVEEAKQDEIFDYIMSQYF